MTPEDFTTTFGPLADDISAATGLHPSVVLGQAAQETGWGNHYVGHNLFGISPSGPQGQYVAQYPSVQHAAQAYVDLINGRYKTASNSPDPATQARTIGDLGYGPNKAYGGVIAERAAKVQQLRAAQSGTTSATTTAPDGPAVPSDEEFLKQAAPAPAPDAPAVPSDADFLRQAGSAATQPPAGTSAPPPDTGGIRFDPARAAIIGNSVLRGLHQGLDVPAEALARGADWVGNKLGMSSGQGPQTAAADQAFNQNYDANPLNQGIGPGAARLAGNVLATLPAGIAAGSIGSGLAARGVLEATKAAGSAAPYVGAALSKVPTLAGGLAGGASVSAQTGAPIQEGAALGGALGVGGSVLADVGNLVKSSNPAVVAAITNHGIPLRAGQVSGSKLVNYLDDITAPASSNAAQRTAVTVDAARQMGVTPEIAASNGLPAGQITPKVMQFAKEMNGGTMNAVESRTTIPMAPKIVGDLHSIALEASKTPTAFKDITPHIKDVMDAFEANGGSLPGSVYGKLVAHGSPLDVATNADNSAVRNYAVRIKGALQDAMQAASTPEDAALYAQARLQYKNMITLAPLVNKGIPGQISPLLLQGAANRSFKGNAFSGSGALGELGDVAQTFLKAPPQSGTEPREFIRASLYGDLKGLAKTAAALSAGRAVQGVLGRNPLQPFAVPSAGSVAPAIPTAVLLRNERRNLLEGPAQQ